MESAEKEVKKLSEQIEKTKNLFGDIDLEFLAEQIRKISEEYQTQSADQTADETIHNLIEDIYNIQPVITQARNALQNSKMQVEAKEVIAGIPAFSGDVKLLDGFLNAAELYYNLVEDHQKPTVLKIIKAKVTGEALAKAGPFEDEINTWALLKKRLIERIKKPVSLEYVQEDLNQVFQKKGESIEEYDVKSKLKKLNEASKKLTESNDQVKVLRKVNEKQAINKFEQNIRDPTIKVLVSAAGKSTLDDCIAFAMQKE